MALPDAMNRGWSHIFLFVLVFGLLREVESEVTKLDLVIQPEPIVGTSLHIFDNYLRGPDATLDLSLMIFQVVAPFVEADETSYMDIVVFPQSDECNSQNNGDECSFHKLGLGLADSNATNAGTQWCCTADMEEEGVCSQAGRLLVNNSLFIGARYVVEVAPSEGSNTTNNDLKSILNGTLNNLESGRYYVVLSNCDQDNGQNVQVQGNVIWSSSTSLPEKLAFLLWVYPTLAIISLVSVLWYGMKLYHISSQYEFQFPFFKWFMIALSLQFFESTFRSIDIISWNSSGSRLSFMVAISTFLGVVGAGVVFCLSAMIVKGWSFPRCGILLVISFYVLVKLLRDFVWIYDISLTQSTEDYDKKTSEKLETFTGVLFVVTLAMNICLFIWMCSKLGKTMRILEDKEPEKVSQYQPLMGLFIFSMIASFALFAAFMLTSILIDDPEEREQGQYWIQAADKWRYLVVLTGSAYLWRPRPEILELTYFSEEWEDDDEDSNQDEDEEDVKQKSAKSPKSPRRRDTFRDDDDNDNETDVASVDSNRWSTNIKDKYGFDTANSGEAIESVDFYRK